MPPARLPGTGNSGRLQHLIFQKAAEQRGDARNPWPLMGEYMRARGHARVALMADDLTADSQAREAAEMAMAGFEATRERVRAGEPDPLRLSVASLGEQARLLKRLGRLQEAIQLYAEQAALGSDSGRQSVFFMTRWARTQPEALEAFLDFPLGRELLVLYAYTHFPSSSATRDNEAWSAYRHQNDSGDERVGFRDVFEQILNRLESLPPEQLPATDRLAALLYRQGHFERAERTVAWLIRRWPTGCGPSWRCATASPTRRQNISTERCAALMVSIGTPPTIVEIRANRPV